MNLEEKSSKTRKLNDDEESDKTSPEEGPGNVKEEKENKSSDKACRLKACNNDKNLEELTKMKKTIGKEDSCKPFLWDGKEGVAEKTEKKSSEKVHRMERCNDSENFAGRVDKMRRANDEGLGRAFPRDGKGKTTEEPGNKLTGVVHRIKA